MALLFIAEPDGRHDDDRGVCKDPPSKLEPHSMLGQIGRALVGIEFERCHVRYVIYTVLSSWPFHMLRAMIIFMISFEPPKMRVMRLSRNIFAMGYSLI